MLSACQRCRLKKCKCDGLSPCARCKTDNKICAYGNNRRTEKSMYRKEYVHMLERQQSQLIAGIQSVYQMMKNGESWPGPPLDHDAYGQPLTHKMLEGLGILGSDHWEDLAAISPCLKVPGSPSLKDEVLDMISPSSTDSQLSSVSSISRKPSMPQPTLVATARSDLEEPFALNDPWTSPPRSSPPPIRKRRGKPDMVLQMPPPLSAYLGEHGFEFEQNFAQIMGLNDWKHGRDGFVNLGSDSGSPSYCTSSDLSVPCFP